MKKGLRARPAAAARPPPIRAKTRPISDSRKEKSSLAEETSGHRAAEDLENILNSSRIAILVLDRDLKLRFFSPAAASLFEITASNLGGPLSGITRRFADDDLLLDAKTVIVTRVSLWREVEADSGAWYNRRLLPYRAADNKIQGVVMTFADISEMKAVEQESETARAYSNSIIDTIRQSLVVLDHELNIVSASPSFYRSFAVKPDEAVGQQLPKLRDRCLDVPTLCNFLNRIAAGHEVTEDYEIEIDLPPRGRRVLLLNAREIAAALPAKKKILLTIDDITDRKQAEMALETAKKRAERANLGKSRFLAAASHDLRQPLQTIALLQGVLASKQDPDTLQLAGRLGESLDVMSGMLNKLLDINELEAGIVKPAPLNFPIRDLLERLRSEFTGQARDKGLRCHVISSRQNVRSDPDLLEQMIRNLLSNALKYTSHGKILLGCRRRGDRLRIEVCDTGSGIPERELDAVFEEFHQLDNPARERSRGLGLGLSIVQRLADLLGHTIDVRSRPGKGSVFSIEVPCVAKEAQGALRPEVQAPVARVSEGKSILVIEDDPAIREMLQLLFQIDGYHTTAAADGKSGLELIARGTIQPHIVIADYNLPNGLTGLDVAARLRETFDRALPVLIVTGDISTDTLRAIAKAGCVQLNKPIRAEELIRLVRAQLADAPKKSDRSQKQRPAAALAGEPAATVFLVDDDDALREAMRELLARGGRSVEAFASGEAFLEAYRPGRNGCLVVDARLPGLGGVALMQRLKAEHHALPSIMITGHGEISMAVEAMKAGAMDFIEKPVSANELLDSIDRALDLARDSMALTAWHETAAGRIGGLTPRERQIMDLVITGHPNKIIADDLGVSQRTVENHRAAVMKKTGSKSLSDLVRLAIAAA